MPNHVPYLGRSQLITKVKNQFSDPVPSEDIARYLKNISYYDLIKGYKKTALKNHNNCFKSGIDINVLYQIHWIDTSLGNLLLKFSIESEKHLKAMLSEVVTNFGDAPDQYLNDRHYRNASTKVFQSVYDMIQCDTDHAFSDEQKSFGTIPSWFTIHKVTLGQAISWYGRLRPFSKRQIARSFMRPPITVANLKEADELNMFRAFLGFILEVRNKAAHGRRILNLDIQENIQARWLREAGITDYFSLDSNGRVLRNVPNYLAIIILMTDIPLFGANVVNEIAEFLRRNSVEGANPLDALDISMLDLYDISSADLERLRKLYQAKFA